MPENGAGRFFLEVEQIQLATDAPVVALLRLFETVQVVLQLLLIGPRRSINALEHFVPRIATPVRARDLRQLEGPELAGRRYVRPPAKVLPLALAVQRDFLASRNCRDDFSLVVLADRIEVRNRGLARQETPPHRLVGLHDLTHLCFELLEILGRKGALECEVVVEAVLDDRADRHLCLGINCLDRLGQQVSRRVPQDLEPLRILRRDDADLRVAGNDVRGVNEFAVDNAGERGARKTLADRRRDIGDADRAVEGPLAAIGKGDYGHCIWSSDTAVMLVDSPCGRATATVSLPCSCGWGST